ncbi:head GIN domain-containing protein [Roseateles violae]|uniref:Head GIN domain-containing protein n=1 Tax=Roseateles violae TaxID=3058042 RepID=A0ABT8DLR5_9BURK|nr:head GIN domain-containing protein [Pelomonas sp. PFR6]MDN3918848.1 head GIN domain-containing protein [Pelomonas sp. PFR6]
MRSKAAAVAFLFGLCAALAQAQPSEARPEGRLYEPGAFDRLELDGSAKVKLVQGERDQVFIVGGEDVQRNVEIELNNGRLRIHPSGGWKFWSSSRLQVEVQMRRLSQLTISGASDVLAVGPIRAEKLSVHISGAGQVRLDELKAEQLRFDISGAGDGQLGGQVEQLSLSVSGKGKLLAEQLRASSATVSISGVGNANLWVTDSLRVSISGIGNVDYWGQPQQVRRSTSGLGSITARGEKR